MSLGFGLSIRADAACLLGPVCSEESVAVPRAGLQPQGASPSPEVDGDGDEHHQLWAPAHGPKCWGIVWLRSLLTSDLAGAVRNTVGLVGLLHKSQQLGTMIWGLILHSPAARADADAEVEHLEQGAGAVPCRCPPRPWGCREAKSQMG